MRTPIALITIICLARGTLCAAPPDIARVSPLAVAAGQTTTLRLFGARLSGATSLWTNLPCSVKLPVQSGPDEAADKRLIAFVTTSDAAAPAYYGLRVVTPAGVSRMHLVMVDDLRTVAEAESEDAALANNSRATAQPLAVPVAVDGIAEAESYDYYSFEVVAGQTISAEVVARRLGSPLDPVLVLSDARGRELAYSDDDPSVGIDGRLSHQFAESGVHYLEVRDIRYQGGDDYFYRLRVGDFPITSTAYPLAATRGATARVGFTGPRASHTAVQSPHVPANVSARTRSLAARFDGQTEGGASIVPLAVVDTIEQVEFEPNDTRETAMPLATTAGMSGQIDRPNDADHFVFQAKKGQKWRVTGTTRPLGSPVDLYVRVLKPDGTPLAEVDAPGGGEVTTVFETPDDGAYTLAVQDLHGRGGDGFAYRVVVEPDQPTFRLSLDSETYHAPKSGMLVIRVTAERLGYDGPIALETASDDKAFPKFTGQIAKDKNDGAISARVDESFAPGSVLFFNVIGRGTGPGGNLIVRADASAALATAMGGLVAAPAGLGESICVGVGPVYPSFFEFSLGQEIVTVPQMSAKASIPTKLTRAEGFIGTVTVSAVQSTLPRGVTVARETIARNQADATVEVELPAAAAPGDYPITLVASGTNEDQPQNISRQVVLRVVAPLRLALEPLTEASEGKRGFKLRVERAGVEGKEVRLRWLICRRGERTPIEGHAGEVITLAGDASEANHELALPADVDAAAVEVRVSAEVDVAEKRVFRTMSDAAPLRRP